MPQRTDPRAEWAGARFAFCSWMSDRKSLVRIIVEPIVVACVLALAVRAVARIYSVPSASMSPTLRPGDHIVVTRYLSDRPGRGDVVVFYPPSRRVRTALPA